MPRPTSLDVGDRDHSTLADERSSSDCREAEGDGAKSSGNAREKALSPREHQTRQESSTVEKLSTIAAVSFQALVNIFHHSGADILVCL